jgi:hypothetical protein
VNQPDVELAPVIDIEFSKKKVMDIYKKREMGKQSKSEEVALR